MDAQMVCFSKTKINASEINFEDILDFSLFPKLWFAKI
jgi:hypothetical protein